MNQADWEEKYGSVREEGIEPLYPIKHRCTEELWDKYE